MVNYLPQRTVFLIGLAYHLGSGVEQDHVEGYKYFNYVKEHGNGDICFELSHAYSELGDEFTEESIECLEISAKKGNKIAEAMLREMKENPYILPKA